MKTPRLCVVAVFAFLGLILASSPAARADFTVLHTFTGSTSDGASPVSSLIVSGTTLYGMTNFGGVSNRGTIFKIGTNGAGFGLLHSFPDPGVAFDGRSPMGSLFLSGGTLYGAAQYAGQYNNNGVVFKVSTAGTSYSVLHSFVGGTTDGSTPYASPVESGGMVYGMTHNGGAQGYGTIYRLSLTGTPPYSLLHSFGGGEADGSGPYGMPLVSGGILYGMTANGGQSGLGTVFGMGLDGGGFSVLHSFSSADGYQPNGSLIQSGSTLFGMTRWGGANGLGTIFSLGDDGTYHVLHSFSYGGDGLNPADSLTLYGNTLYGMTPSGGAHGNGAIFGINTDGGGYNILYSFTGGNDGYNPTGSLVVSGGVLYGMAAGSGGHGTIFSLTIPTPPLKAGDTDGDYKIDGVDLATLSQNWDPLGTGHTWAQGDFDGNGVIDGIDLAALAQNWNPLGYSGGQVPEPATMSLLALGALAMIRGRRIP